jgi:hypothetical protein
MLVVFYWSVLYNFPQDNSNLPSRRRAVAGGTRKRHTGLDQVSMVGISALSLANSGVSIEL